MGMGAAPAHAWTISLDSLRRICPNDVAACEKVFAEHGYDWNSFALALDKNDLGDVDDTETLCGPWESLQAAFKTATAVGASALELGIGYYNAEDGDLYDELDEGAYFTVEGVTMLTPAGEKLRNTSKRKAGRCSGRTPIGQVRKTT